MFLEGFTPGCNVRGVLLGLLPRAASEHQPLNASGELAIGEARSEDT